MNDIMNDIRSRYMSFIIVTYRVALEDLMNDKCYEWHYKIQKVTIMNDSELCIEPDGLYYFSK